MKLVIEIPDYRYRAIKEIDLTKKLYTINERSAIIAIKNGQPFSETYKAGIKEEDEKGARLEM